MRLRSQLVLSALGTSLLCGILGTMLLGRTVSQSAEPLLESALRTGGQALTQKWTLRRAERRASYDLAARQTYLRAYLAAGDRGPLEYFTQLTRKQGADLVAIVDRSGAVVARDGIAADLMATQATQLVLGADGELTPLGTELYDVFRLPVQVGETLVGYLVAGNLITDQTLRADTESFGIDAAVAVSGLMVSTFPKDSRVTLRSLDDGPSSDHHQLPDRYRLRTSNFGHATLLIGVPLTHISAFGTDFVRQLAGVLLVIMIATAVVALIVVERITGPIEKLKEAADLLGRGQLLRTRSLLQDFTDREDEIGALARAFNIAAQRLDTFVAASQRLVRHLNIAVNAVERSASAVAGGAAQQEERLEQVAVTLGPLTAALEQTSRGLADARNAAISLSLVTSAADQALAMMTAAVRRSEVLLNNNENPDQRGGYRTASLLQQMGLVSKLNGDQRDAFLKVREQVTALKRLLDEAVEAQIREQHQGEFVHRATSDIGRLAKQHNAEALALRTSAQQLRRDMEHLHKLLTAIDAQGQIEFDETAAASSGYYRPIRSDANTSSSDRIPAIKRPPRSLPSGSSSRPDVAAISPSSLSGRVEERSLAGQSERSGRFEYRSPASPTAPVTSDRSGRIDVRPLNSPSNREEGRPPSSDRTTPTDHKPKTSGSHKL